MERLECLVRTPRAAADVAVAAPVFVASFVFFLGSFRAEPAICFKQFLLKAGTYCLL